MQLVQILHKHAGCTEPQPLWVWHQTHTRTHTRANSLTCTVCTINLNRDVKRQGVSQCHFNFLSYIFLLLSLLLFLLAPGGGVGGGVWWLLGSTAGPTLWTWHGRDRQHGNTTDCALHRPSADCHSSQFMDRGVKNISCEARVTQAVSRNESRREWRVRRARLDK